MTPIGTPELVLLLVALGGMTAAATWAVIELKTFVDRFPPAGIETGCDMYYRHRGERPLAFWWHQPRKKTWSMGRCGLESGDASSDPD